ncbi:TPA: OmpH family outer membrane protein [Candidatus Bipolaricaulota bacterium]|nr:OmpH family outer membrane protein [Candidatus Bipolaricaulota bacterium]
MKASMLAAVVIGALVAGFVGGIVAGLLFQGGGDVSGLESRIAGVESRLASLESRVAALPQEAGLRVAYVDAEDLFMKVFLPQVDAERQAMAQKQQEVQQLQARHIQGEIDQEEYQQQGARLQAELLQAQLNVNLTMLDKMIASPGFANFRGDLERIRDSARPLATEVGNLVQSAQVGIVDLEGFMATYQQLKSAFQQLDQLLTQAAAAKIVEIAQQVAREQGLDLVLRKKDVLIYYNDQKITDISGEVEGRLWGLFSSS